MNRQRVEYTRRRRNGAFGCTCDCNYAKSLQGICKIVQLFVLGLAWILIAASPYYRPIFVIGGETWPFHVVLLLSILSWLATLGMYVLFMSGFHLSMPSKNWPKIELIYNIVMVVMVLIAACLEAGNVWRWDMSRGNVLTGGSSYSSYYQYGLRPGMSFTQTLNFGSYCGQRPQECSDYFNLLAGNNSYYTNHLFAVVLLFFALIAYLISTFFAYRTLRVFQRDMYKPGKMPKPTMWMKFQYRVENAANKARNRVGKVTDFIRNRGDVDDDGDEVDTDGVVLDVTVNEKNSLDLESGFSPVSSRSEGRHSRAKSHSSHHSTHRSHSEKGSGSRSHHHHDDDVKSSRSSSNDRTKNSSRHPSSHDRHSVIHEHRSSIHEYHSHHGSNNSSHGNGKSGSDHVPHIYEVVPPPKDEDMNKLVNQSHDQKTVSAGKKNSKKQKKGQSPEQDFSPVASVMI